MKDEEREINFLDTVLIFKNMLVVNVVRDVMVHNYINLICCSVKRLEKNLDTLFVS